MDIVQSMLPYSNNAQTQRLQEVLKTYAFLIMKLQNRRDKELSEQNLVYVEKNNKIIISENFFGERFASYDRWYHNGAKDTLERWVEHEI